jgi:hypothetical protein
MKMRILIAAGCFAALVGCVLNPDDNASLNGNSHSSISGTMLRSDGKSPASEARVTLQPSNDIVPIVGSAMAKIKANRRMVMTDANGDFAIDSCDTGVYVIEAIGDEGKAVRIDSIVVRETGITTEIPPQSLQATGAIRGTVALDAGGDPGNVFILAFGSDRFAQAHDDGNFFLGDLPYGRYDLNFVCLLTEYGGCKTKTVSVTPGDTVSIDTVAFEAQAPCVPKNVTLRYDTTKLIVTLRWDSCTSLLVKGYNVYRSDTAAGTFIYKGDPLNKGGIIGTCSYEDRSLCFNKSYVYGVAAVSKDRTISMKCAPLAVTTAFPYHSDTLTYDSVEGWKVSNLFWNTENRLVVAYSSPSGASIVDYGETYSIVRRSDIATLSHPASNIIVRGENVYMKTQSYMWDRDSVIYCYKRNGTFRFACNVHKLFQKYDVRNDTFVAVTDSGTTLVFDTTGRLLFNLKPNDELNRIEAQFADDGSLIMLQGSPGAGPDYPYSGDEYMWELHKFDFTKMDEVTCISAIGYGCDLNVCGNFMTYCLLNSSIWGSIVADLNGNLVAQFPDMYLFPGAAFNSRGQIAYTNTGINWRYIIILTPFR